MSAFEISQGHITYILINNWTTVEINQHIFLVLFAIHNIVLFDISMDYFESMEELDMFENLSLIDTVGLWTLFHWELNAVVIDNQIETEKPREFRSYFQAWCNLT